MDNSHIKWNAWRVLHEIIRVILFFITSAALILFLYFIIIIDLRLPIRSSDIGKLWIFSGIILVLALNLLHLLVTPTRPPGAKPGRIRRLIRLWLDAKEHELRVRSGGV